MGFFSKKEDHTKKELSTVKTLMHFHFSDVKHRLGNLFQWINYFHHKHKEHDSRLENIELYLAQLPSSKEQIKQVIDEHYSQKEIFDRISGVEKKLHQLYFSNQKNDLPLDGIKERIEALEKRKEVIKNSLRDKMIRNVTKNSKDYIKSTILAVLRKYGRISAFRLKEMIVEEQGLCSKSSFYRVLEEIEKDGEFSSSRDGREKIFFFRGIDEKQLIE